MQITTRSQTSSRSSVLIAGLLLYCGAFAILLGNKSFEPSGAVVVLVVFAIVLPLIAWVTTRHALPLSISIEFFFRALVQSQLAAAFKSEVSGIVLMSVIFGLAHAPGFIFRHAGELEGLDPHPGSLDAVAYSIVILAVSGITFGIIWARTKNLFALMLVHAAGDLLPNFGTFIQTWF